MFLYPVILIYKIRFFFLQYASSPRQNTLVLSYTVLILKYIDLALNILIIHAFYEIVVCQDNSTT